MKVYREIVSELLVLAGDMDIFRGVLTFDKCAGALWAHGQACFRNIQNLQQQQTIGILLKEAKRRRQNGQQGARYASAHIEQVS